MHIMRACIAFVVVFISSAVLAKSQECEIIVRFENYSAQSQLDADMRWYGLDVDFAKLLLDEAQCRYRFISLPWGRALKMLEEGDIDLMLSVSKTAQRMRFAYFIGPQRQENIVFATHAEHPFYVNSIEGLFSLTKPVAIQRGAYYGPDFEARMKLETDSEEKFIYVPDNQLKLNLLRHGRISGFLEEKYNIIYQTEHNPDFVAIDMAPLIVNTEPVYFALSKQSVDKPTIAKLTQAYERLKRKGKFEEILKKYKLD